MADFPPSVDRARAYSKGWACGFAAGRYVGWCHAVGSRIAYVVTGAALVLVLPIVSKWIGQ